LALAFSLAINTFLLNCLSLRSKIDLKVSSGNNISGSENTITARMSFGTLQGGIYAFLSHPELDVVIQKELVNKCGYALTARF